MNRTSILALVVVALASCAVLASAQCTPQTCRGPTEVYYTSPNCTGEVDSYYEEDGDNTVGACNTNSRGSYKLSCDSTNGLVYSYYDDSACTKFTYSEAYAVGTCIVDGDYTYAYVCNVNDTIPNPRGYPDTSLPKFVTQIERCYSPENCTALNPVYYATVYSSERDDCQLANATDSQAIKTSANASLDTCFYNNDYNMKLTCTEDYLIVSEYRNAAGCVGTPLHTIAYSKNCARNLPLRKRDFISHGLGHSQKHGFSLLDSIFGMFARDADALTYFKIGCTPSPTPQAVPTSAASPSLPFGSLMLAVLLVAIGCLATF